jgi:hypothetical protein
MQGEWIGGRFKTVFGGHYAGERQYTFEEIERRRATYTQRDEQAASDLAAEQSRPNEEASEGNGSRVVTPEGGPLLGIVDIQPVEEGADQTHLAGAMLPVTRADAVGVDPGSRL